MKPRKTLDPSVADGFKNETLWTMSKSNNVCVPISLTHILLILIAFKYVLLSVFTYKSIVQITCYTLYIFLTVARPFYTMYNTEAETEH